MDKRILTEIWIYPVKALGGIRMRSSRVMEKGLQYDRRWMLVDGDNIFMTQRDFPMLALFKLSIEENGFKIKKGDAAITLPFKHSVIEQPVYTIVWDDPVTTFEVSEAHSRWFSERLGMNCKLVSFPEENPRPVSTDYAIHDEHVSLADGFPLLIIGQSSLDHLNQQLKSEIPMNRFRPNLVFSPGQPHEEDDWKDFTIGKNRFVGVKPCARCAVPTVNQETGEKGIEPLATLAKYRRKENKVFFGQNVLAVDHDEINEGDEIVVGG